MNRYSRLLPVTLIVLVATTISAHAQGVTQDLLVWFKADTGVTVDGTGSHVVRWADQSGNANDATQIVAPHLQPTLVTNALNGLPVLRFEGIPAVSSDYLELTNSPLNLTSGLSMFILARNQTRKWNGLFRMASSSYLGPSNLEVWWKDGTTDDASGQVLYVANGNLYPGVYGEIDSYDAGPPVGRHYIYDAVASSSTAAQRVNGLDTGFIYPSPMTTNFLPTAANTAFLGVGNGNAFLYGDIAEVLIYDTTLSSQQRDNVWAYLEGKYSLGIPEPSTLALAGLGCIVVVWRRRQAAE